MDLRLAGAGAIVTGGSRGIGKAVARALLAEGARVALLSRTPEHLAEAAAELGDGVVTVPVDTTDAAAVTAAVDEAAAALGRLDVLVNCAATPASSTGVRAGIESLDEEDFLTQLDTKGLGYARAARAALPHLRAVGGGRIVNVAGMNARLAGSLTATVRNLAVVALTKSLADELGGDNIAVTCVHPGVTATDSRTFDEAMQTRARANALGRVIDAAEVADLVTFLASPRATAVNGSIIAVDGGHVGPLWT